MLSVLEEKLAEAHGLAMAATVVTAKVEALTPLDGLRSDLETMRRDAEETRARCLHVEEAFGEELAHELLAHATSTKERSADLLPAWFKAGTGPLRAWVFLAMGEAAEVAAWTALAELARTGDVHASRVRELATWGLPIQQGHLRTALDGAAALGRSADPNAPRWG